MTPLLKFTKNGSFRILSRGAPADRIRKLHDRPADDSDAYAHNHSDSNADTDAYTYSATDQASDADDVAQDGPPRRARPRHRDDGRTPRVLRVARARVDPESRAYE